MEVQKKSRPLEFVNGESIPVLGKRFRLRISLRPLINRPLVQTQGSRLNVTVAPTDRKAKLTVKESLQEWLTEKTATYVLDKINSYKKLLGISPSDVKVVSQGRRWGSCSSRGMLRFNWKLSMMPPPVINYIIVHELAHIKVHNHSNKFWYIVQSLIPDYKQRREWLRLNGQHLWTA